LRDEEHETPCQSCEIGRARQVRYEQWRAEQEQVAVAQRLAAMRAAANTPARFRPRTLETFPAHATKAVATVREFLAGWNGERGIVLYGGYGVGKSSLLCAALDAILQRWATQAHLASLRAYFTTTTNLLHGLRAGYRDGTYDALMERCQHVRLLAIDDLGVEKVTDWVLEKLFEILNERYNALLPTFVTTNFDPEQLGHRTEPRVVERLLETCDVIEVCGPNLRRVTDPRGR
jgi:DNA replication protein DnaC